MSDTAAQLEMLIEAKIVSAITAVISDRQVIGFWTAAADGTPKEIGASNVSVMTSLRESEDYDSDNLTIKTDVRITGAVEDDATCQAFPLAVQALMGVFGLWNTDDDALAAAMDITNVFRCDALKISNGGTPGYNDADKFWFVDIGLEIKGCIITSA